MRFPPWGRGDSRPRDSLQGSGPVDATAQRITELSAAAARGSVDAAAVSAVAAAAGLVERAFLAADIAVGGEPLPAAIRASIGRAFVEAGESCFLIAVAPGEPTELLQAATWDVTGGSRPSTWRYRLDLAGPSRTTAARIEAAGVLHFAANTSAAEPWKGRPGWKVSKRTSELAGAIEASLKAEALLPAGRIAPFPSIDQAPEYGQRLAAGGIVPVSLNSVVLGDPLGTPGAWTPSQIGPAPSPGLVALRDQVTRDVASAAGVPPELLVAGSMGARDAWRRFMDGSLEGWGRLVVEELSEKLEAPAAVDWSRLVSADVAALRSRAYEGLLRAGMDATEAAALVGFGGDDA